MNDKDNAEPIVSDDNDLARKYVLEVLEGEALSAFQDKLSSSETLRAEVARWQEHFTALGMNIDDAAPNATVLGHLKRELWSENKLPWNRRIRIWEYALGGIAAAAVAFADFRFGDGHLPVATVTQAEIMNAAQEPKFRFALRSDTGLLQIERFVVPAEDGYVFVVWGYERADAPLLRFGAWLKKLSVFCVSAKVLLQGLALVRILRFLRSRKRLHPIQHPAPHFSAQHSSGTYK